MNLYVFVIIHTSTHSHTLAERSLNDGDWWLVAGRDHITYTVYTQFYFSIALHHYVSVRPYNRIQNFLSNACVCECARAHASECTACYCKMKRENDKNNGNVMAMEKSVTNDAKFE